MSHKDVLKAAGLSEAEISGGTLAVVAFRVAAIHWCARM